MVPNSTDEIPRLRNVIKELLKHVQPRNCIKVFRVSVMGKMPFFAKTVEGRIVKASDKLEENTSTFTCNECNDRMILVKSSSDGKKRSHFRHTNPDRNTSCNGGESEKHYLAKMLIVTNIDRILFSVKCGCNMNMNVKFEGKPVPELAYRNRKLDVGIINDKNEVTAGIEVYHTHFVDDEKKLDLTKLQWLEVEADEILSHFNPSTLETIGDFSIVMFTMNSNRLDCDKCQEWRKECDRMLVQSNGMERFVQPLTLVTAKWKEMHSTILRGTYNCFGET